MTRRTLPALLLCACGTVEVFSGSLDTPGAVVVLDPVAGGPYLDPVAYVADRVGGTIRALDPVRGTYLAATPAAPWLRAPFLATGADRLLVGVVPRVVDADTIELWAADRARAELLRVPHVDGRSAEGAPVPVVPRLVSATFDDADASGDAPELDGLTLDPDTATSETWTITFTGQDWQVDGSLSGRDRPAPPGVLWSSRTGALSFVPRGGATPGDRFVVEVDRGVEALPLPGTPTELVGAPDGRWMALVHADGEGRALRLVDPATGALEAPLALPADARPGRLAWSPDGRFLYAADNARAAVWEVEIDTGVIVERTLPWPTTDLAVLVTASTRQLYVVPSSGTSVWIVDLNTGALLDLNPATPEVDGMSFLSPVTGLAPMPARYEWPSYRLLDEDDDGADDDVRYGQSVAVTLHAGKVVWMRAGTGCLVTEPEGPRTQLIGTSALLGDYEPDFDIQVPGTAYLDATDDDLRHILVNPCSGLVPSQSWEMQYDAAAGAWRVRGNASGRQERLAYEEERYVSDQGEVSFTLRAGTIPSQPGWRIRFSTLDGALRGDGDSQDDRVREVDLDMPQRPAAVYAHVDGRMRAWVLVPASGSDIVTRISATDAIVDAVWE